MLDSDLEISPIRPTQVAQIDEDVKRSTALCFTEKLIAHSKSKDQPEMMVKVSLDATREDTNETTQEVIQEMSSVKKVGKDKLFQNIQPKYDIFGMKIKSYEYQPSSSEHQTNQDAEVDGEKRE